MEQRQYKNSGVVIAKKFIIFEIVIAAVIRGAEGLLSDEADLGPVWQALMCILTVLNAYSCWYIVEHTVFTFDGNKLTVSGKFVSRNKSEIQYSRMASVGITRSILDRMLGVSTLTFNVNSGVNSSAPDATLCIEREEAERLRTYLNGVIFGMRQEDAPLQETADDARMPDAGVHRESLVKVTNREIIVHSFLSQSSPQLLLALALIVWGAWSALSESVSGGDIALYLFVLEEVIPIVSVCCRYYNYRIERAGDTVVVEYGMFTQKTVSFRENKVNSVRLRPRAGTLHPGGGGRRHRQRERRRCRPPAVPDEEERGCPGTAGEGPAGLRLAGRHRAPAEGREAHLHPLLVGRRRPVRGRGRHLLVPPR